LWLALALVAAPQLSYVHALSHHASAGARQSAEHERQQAADKVCEICLTLAHLGHAVATQQGWSVMVAGPVVPVTATVTSIANRAPAHFQARAPPTFL
jgi:hypothetical protein